MLRARVLTFILAVIGLVVGGVSASAPARAADDAAGFISDLGRRAVTVLTSASAESEREKQFRVLFNEGFDVPGISRFVLGPYWRTATDAQREDFQKLFETYV